MLTGKKEYNHCEMYEFARYETKCEKQCDSCKWFEDKHFVFPDDLPKEPLKK